MLGSSRTVHEHHLRRPGARPCSASLLIGLINGSFYAMLSLGLAVIFGLLRVINFAHGAQYMLGAFAAYLLLTYLGIGYWPALIARAAHRRRLRRGDRARCC